MKILLDTNAFIWASREPHLLSPVARVAILDPFNERFVSIASLWEMQIKHGLGKLPLPGKIDQIGPMWLRSLVAKELSLELRHVGTLYDLAPVHRDPFDRILIAQAITENMTIVSADAAIRAYSVTTLW